MMSPKQTSEDRGSPQFGHTPFQIIHILGNFLRIWSVYSMYRYLTQTGASVVLFIFCCLVPATILFLFLQKPWKGRPLSNTQVVPSVINGAITAFYFVLWGKGLKLCGPLRALMAEYSGAVLGVLSAVLYGQRQHVWKKVGGLMAMVASFYLLSQGWAMASYFPIIRRKPRYRRSDRTQSGYERNDTSNLCGNPVSIEESDCTTCLTQGLGVYLSGIISNQYKRRLHAITVASATCFLFPVAMWDMIIGSESADSKDLPFSTWAFISTIAFGIILIFYIDNIAEERLHMVFSSPRHLMVAGGCIIIMEIVYQVDFSLLGFLICALILGFGIHAATSLQRPRGDSLQKSSLSDDIFGDQVQMSPLPT